MTYRIYTRVSTDEQVDGTSLQNQKITCIEFVKRLLSSKVTKENVDWVLYEECGASGGSMERPALTKLRREICQGDIVVTTKPDRLSRSIRDIIHLVLTEFEKKGVLYKTVEGSIDTQSPTGKLLFCQLASFADFERSLILERTIKGRRHRTLKDGKYSGGRPPYGYKLVEKQLYPDETEFPIAKRIFNLLLKGYGGKTICTILNAEKVPTRHGRPWERSMIYYMARSPLMTGRKCFARRGLINGTRRYKAMKDWEIAEEMTHEPIISDKERNIILAKMEARRTSFGSNRSISSGFLLSSIHCDHCGRKLIGNTARFKLASGEFKKLGYYQCITYQNVSKDLCPFRSIRQDRVEADVITKIRELVANYGNQAYVQKQIDAEMRRRAKENPDSRNLILKRVAEIDRNIHKWQRAFEHGGLSEKVAVERLNNLAREREQLIESAKQQEATNNQNILFEDKIEMLKQLAGNFNDLWASFTNEQRKQIVGFVVKDIRVDKDKNIAIEWKL